MNNRAVIKFSLLMFAVLFLFLHIPVYIMGCISGPFAYVDCQFRGVDVSDGMTNYSWVLAFPLLILFLILCVALIFLLSKFINAKLKVYIRNKAIK